MSVILSNDKLLKQWHDTLQNVVRAQDWREVTDSLKGYMTPELKKKLDGIANGANNYVHPSSHPASMIAQDATHRFVSDTEKNTWNAKASTAVVSTTANGLMPKRNGNASYIFTGDGVWKSLAWNLITGKPSTFPPSTHNHDSSYLKRDNNNKNDLNSCTVEGIYRFSGTLTGGWTGTSWGTLLVLNNQYNGGSGISGTYLVQLAFPTDNTIRMRQRVNTDAWSSWVTLARTSDNITSATKATQDSRGQQIDTTYIKGVTGSNATLTVTKGNGTTSTTTINNVANATNAKIVSNTAADGSTIDLVTGTMASNDGFRIRVGGSNNNGYVEIATKDDGSEPIYMRQYTGDFNTITRTATILDGSGNTSFPGKVTASGGFSGNLSGTATNATNATSLSNKGEISATTLPNNLTAGLTTHAAYNNSYPAMYGNVINVNNQGKSQLLLEWKGDDTAAEDPGHLYYRECRDNQNAWSNWKTVAFTTDNVSSATKATQDSAGQTINTTYVKGVTANNATLTITKGNGSTSTTTINNVSNATNLVYSNMYKLNYGNGDVDENNVISQNKANLVIGSWYSTGFRDLCSSDNPIHVAINHRNGNIKTTGNITASGAMYSATPKTTDNGTRVATTAFVKSLFTASKATNGWWKDGNTGMIWQWGQEESYHDIMDSNYGSSGSLSFPISFPNKCLAVMPYLLGNSTFCCVSVSSFTNTKITVHWDEWSGNVQSVKFGYLAMGY